MRAVVLQMGRHPGWARAPRSRLVIQVDSMDAPITELAAGGIDAETPTSVDGSDDFRTTWMAVPHKKVRASIRSAVGLAQSATIVPPAKWWRSFDELRLWPASSTQTTPAAGRGLR